MMENTISQAENLFDVTVKFGPVQPAHVDDEAVKSNLERQIAALDNSQAASSSTLVMFVEFAGEDFVKWLPLDSNHSELLRGLL